MTKDAIKGFEKKRKIYENENDEVRKRKQKPET